MIDSTLAGIPHARSRVGGHELPARGDPHRHVELKTFFGSRYAHVYFIHQMYLLPGSAKPLKVKTPSFHPPYQVFCASSFPGHRKSHLAFLPVSAAAKLKFLLVERPCCFPGNQGCSNPHYKMFRFTPKAKRNDHYIKHET